MDTSFSIAVCAGDSIQMLISGHFKPLIIRRVNALFFYSVVFLVILFMMGNVIIKTYENDIDQYGKDWVNSHILNNPEHHLSTEKYYGKVQSAIRGTLESTDLSNPVVYRQFLLFLLCAIAIFIVSYSLHYRNNLYSIIIKNMMINSNGL